MSTDQVAAFLSLAITPLTPATALVEVRKRSREPRFSFIVTPNVDHVVRLSREAVDGPFRTAYRAAGLRLCDSRILAALARLCGEDLPVVAGSDLTARLFAETLGPDDEIAIVGGSAVLRQSLEQRYPSFRFIHIAPPMGLAHDTAARLAVVEAVERAGANFVFLAVGAPQSEMIAAEIAARRLAGGVGLCVGASLEFVTGLKRRAPMWMQRLKIEWLHRLMSEPRRLWRRYLVEGPAIFIIVARWRLTGRPV
jgi:exopolysaccharide biosynthesis WecB/TagA/CpsF family protein